MAVEIERVTEVDALFPTLATLLEELHAHHQPFWPRDFVPGWQERWRSYLGAPAERCILLARFDEAPIGYLNGSIRRDPGLFLETFAYIDDAYVRDSQRRGGVGGRMLSEFEDWCRARGVTEVRLGVVANNQLGLGFWRKSGFQPLTYTMTKALDPR
jgi:GNAT superfamily N-acetyltransferase